MIDRESRSAFMALVRRLRSGATTADRPLLVACSGGLDSTALAAAAGHAFPGELIVAHVDHAVRAHSARDAAHVRQLAARLGARFAHRRLTWPDRDRRQRATPGERELRDARYRALVELAAEHGAGAIATAHHHDDQLETILFRVLRGSGWRGYAGIRERRALGGGSGDTPTLWRPFLDVRRHELRAAVDELGLAWLEDPTNRDLGPTRNRVRHLLLPRLRDRTSGAVDAMLLDLHERATTATALADRIWQQVADRVDRGTDGEIRVDRIDDLPAPAIAEAARRVHAELAGGPPLERWVARVVDLATGRPGRRLDAARDVVAWRTGAGLAFRTKSPATGTSGDSPCGICEPDR